MSESLLADVREEQAEATRRVLFRWRRRRIPRQQEDRVRLARELSRLIAEHRANHSDTRKLARELVVKATGKTPEQIDQLNDFLQRYLGLIVGIGQGFQDLASKFATAGHKVEGAESLDDAIAEWRRLREDLPEKLAVASPPVRSALRKRIAEALATTPRAADWRSLFK